MAKRARHEADGRPERPAGKAGPARARVPPAWRRAGQLPGGGEGPAGGGGAGGRRALGQPGV